VRHTRLIAFDNTLSISRHTVASTFGSYFIDFTNGPRNLDVTRYRIVPQPYPCRLYRIAFCVRDARVQDHRNSERFRVDRQPFNAISRRNDCSTSTSIYKLISRTVKNGRLFSFEANEKTSH